MSQIISPSDSIKKPLDNIIYKVKKLKNDKNQVLKIVKTKRVLKCLLYL